MTEIAIFDSQYFDIDEGHDFRRLDLIIKCPPSVDSGQLMQCGKIEFGGPEIPQ